ncbi:hexitol phosphatase HxpB [Xenorhabdus sp. DI]|uniref:hexitol phosphatase HxpB n=2 Tax=Xenorhabdus doucetiae TaxID=351671 RepID=UPI0019933CBA|nr:hexitol phosphatase HxpB [Xenorhabdus sp. DI]MBD2784491.1 hexitol phosphatase HxpB [Xenorhabdus sp. 3]MBD2787514.1 hexitol phosphatase HxpB [Xenorhabdus sp. DI]
MMKAVIFDMDGVLIDSEPLWKKSGMLILNHYGVPITYDEMLSMIGIPVSGMIDRACQLYNKNDLDKSKIEKDFFNKGIELILTEKPLMDGVVECLELLVKKDIKIGIASASPLSFLLKIVEQCGIADYFDYISSAEYMPYNKPHPMVYLNAAEKLNVSPKECLGIEDSKIGMISVKAASMKCVVIPNNIEYDYSYWDASDWKIKKLQELENII